MHPTATDQLFDAINKRDISAVRSALDADADIHALSADGQGVLHTTVEYSKSPNEELVQMLVDAGADVNQKNTNDQTPMDYAMHAPYNVRFGRVLDADGNPMGERRPDETRFAPSSGDVLALFKHNAKATDHDGCIAEIRTALLCYSPTMQHTEQRLEQIDTMLKEQKDPKSVPPSDAPACANNTDDPYLAFAEGLNFVISAAITIAPNQPASEMELIKNIQQTSWEEYRDFTKQFEPEQIDELRDLRNMFCIYVVGSALLRGLDEENLAKVTSQNIDNLLLPNLFSEAYGKLLTTGRRVEQLIDMSESYHRNATVIHDKLNLRIEELEWEPLLKEHKPFRPELEGLQGWSIEHLTTGKELREEGLQLSHCVGGYASACMAGRSHIFSVRNEAGESVSTFEVAADNPYENRPYTPRGIRLPDGTDYILNQHYGEHDKPAPAEAELMLDAFLGAVEGGDIALKTDKKQLGAQDEGAWKDATLLEKMMYHYQSDMTSERQQRVYDVLVGNAEDCPNIRSGRRNYLVAPHYRKMPVEDVLEESGINSDLTGICKLHQLEYNPPKRASQKPPSWQERVDAEKHNAPAQGHGA